MAQNEQSTITTSTTGFSLTENAARRIAYLATQEAKPDAKLRVEVLGGGCSGFQYKFRFDTDQQPGDYIASRDGATVLVDATSLPLVEGATLDYIESLGASHFEIKNPNASASCGCGNSFAV